MLYLPHGTIHLEGIPKYVICKIWNISYNSYYIQNNKSLTMAKYLLIWEINPNYVSEDPAARGAQWKQFMDMVRQDFEKGITKDWGAFIAEPRGFSVVEGSELEIGILAQQFSPYVTFETHACASVEQTMELLNALTGQ